MKEGHYNIHSFIKKTYFRFEKMRFFVIDFIGFILFNIEFFLYNEDKKRFISYKKIIYFY